MRWKRIAIGAAAIVATVFGIGVVRERARATAKPTLSTPKEKLSYSAGISMSRGLKSGGVELDVDLVARGLKDGFSGGTLLMAEDAIRETMNAYQGDQRQKQAEAVQKAAEANRKTADAFLADNAKDEGVVTLPSGLQYKILEVGEGKRPTENDTVECHYRGIRIDGREFDSSYARGKPATLPVAAAIPGWKEALKLMPVGSKWKLFVPPQLAYGERGMRGRNPASMVGPNEPLIFEVELLAIKPTGAPLEQAAAKSKSSARKN